MSASQLLKMEFNWRAKSFSIKTGQIIIVSEGVMLVTGLEEYEDGVRIPSKLILEYEVGMTQVKDFSEHGLKFVPAQFEKNSCFTAAMR